MVDKLRNIRKKCTDIDLEVSVSILSTRIRNMGIDITLRCRLCSRVISHESKNRYGACREEQLCRDCGHFCEINMTSIYRYYYTGEGYRQ